jgi:hypothetical protein
LRFGLLQGRFGGVDVLLRCCSLRQAFLPAEIRLRLGAIGLGAPELGLRLLKLGRKILLRDLETKLLPAILRLGGRQRALRLSRSI